MRQSHTTVIERNVTWKGDFEIEPYEVAWASEAIYFIRALNAAGMSPGERAQVQISPDGIHWVDEGRALPLPTTPGALTFARVDHFGGWLRALGTLPEGASLQVIVYLTLKE